MEFHLLGLQLPDKNILRRAEHFLRKTFLTNVSLAEKELDVSNAFVKERGQYLSTLILKNYYSSGLIQPGSKNFIITGLDIATPVLSFVFGEAQLNGSVAIVSVFRLYEELYSGTKNEELFFTRLYKELLHELGHNFGLLHCENWDCVMHSASIIEEVDIRGEYYCQSCSKRIDRLLR